MLYVLILYISGRTYSLKSSPNDRSIKKLFHGRVFARNLLRGNRRRNTFCILFWYLAWDSNPSITLNNVAWLDPNIKCGKSPFKALKWGLIILLTPYKRVALMTRYCCSILGSLSLCFINPQTSVNIPGIVASCAR